MNLYKQEKAELIKNGYFQMYRLMKKEAFENGYEMSDNPADYGWDELTLDLVRRIEKQTKRKKQNFRNHTWFMSEHYDNIGLLTLGFKDAARNMLSFETIKKRMTQCLKLCFLDYIGMLEISPNGKIHGHFIVGWNGSTITANSYRDGHKNDLVLNKKDLKEFWYGCTLENGQPSRYGIYDLILLPKNRVERNKAANYTLKTLNSMESYITKEEGIKNDVFIDEELVLKVNTSSLIVARGTPYQIYNKLYNAQMKLIKRTCRAIDTDFYNKHKYDGNAAFREWAMNNKEMNITLNLDEHIDLLDKDFELVSVDNFLSFIDALNKDEKELNLKKDFIPFKAETESLTYTNSVPKSDPIINIYGVTQQTQRKEMQRNGISGQNLST